MDDMGLGRSLEHPPRPAWAQASIDRDRRSIRMAWMESTEMGWVRDLLAALSCRRPGLRSIRRFVGIARTSGWRAAVRKAWRKAGSAIRIRLAPVATRWPFSVWSGHRH